MRTRGKWAPLLTIAVALVKCQPGPLKITNHTASATSVEPGLNGGTAYASRLATAGSGAPLHPWTGWDSAIDSMTGNTVIYFPCGFYSYAKPLVLSSRSEKKYGWTLIGGGNGANASESRCTYITYTGTGDGIQIVFPANGTYGAYVELSRLTLAATSPKNTGAGIDDVDGSYVRIHDTTVIGFAYNVVFDQAEVSSIDHCVLGGNMSTTANVWIANDDEHTYGAKGGYTNSISITHNNFEGPAKFAVADDGGQNHNISFNNMEDGSAAAIRQAGCDNCTVIGNETEGNAVGYYGTYRSAFRASVTGPNAGVVIEANLFASNGANAIRFDDGSYNVTDNEVQCASTCIAGDSATSGSAFGDNYTPGSHPVYDEANGVSGAFFRSYNGFGFGTDKTGIKDPFFAVYGPLQPTPRPSSGLDNPGVLNIAGTSGGNTTGSPGQKAGSGASASITAGNGGTAPSGSTNGNGGNIILQAGIAGNGPGAAGVPGAVELNPSGIGTVVSRTGIALVGTTVALGPTCRPSLTGTLWVFTDSGTQEWGARITGRANLVALAFCDGSSWTVIGK